MKFFLYILWILFTHALVFVAGMAYALYPYVLGGCGR